MMASELAISKRGAEGIACIWAFHRAFLMGRMC